MKKIIYVLILSILFASTAFSENKIKEEKEVKLLPLGSVVEVDKDIKLVIMGRLPNYMNKEGVKGYYDYVACNYVGGVPDNKFYYFNHKDIEKIIFEGYIDELELDFQEKYKNEIQSIEATNTKFTKLELIIKTK